MTSGKLRANKLKIGDAVIVYADLEPRKARKVTESGRIGFRLDGNLSMYSNSGEGVEWDLFGNARGERQS
jgi:hypothetical protein